MSKGARVRVPVDGDDTIAAVRCERVTDEKACARFANASLSRDERDLATASDRRLDPRDQFALPDLLRSRAHRDEPAGDSRAVPKEQNTATMPAAIGIEPGRGTKPAGRTWSRLSESNRRPAHYE